MLLGDKDCNSELAYFLQFGSYPKVERNKKYAPPSYDDFDELNYLESNFDIYFEPSRRYHYFRI